ncbi:MAG TPA: amidase [Burkholderiales bacterium]|nr:amidase [Burkholderiales bacterium]
MAKSEFTRLSAVELARLIRTKKASPVEVTEAHLAAIEKVNPAVNAFCTVAAEKALDWAREAERAVKKRARLGALHGVPVAIKDLTPTAGIRTTWGSTLFRDHVPTEDAEIVKRLKAAGAIVIGKTNTPEFGAGANTVNKVFGATRNPWNTALSASGSTGGGAAALAARMAPLAEGSDFGGSLRTPAAFCGVVGLRTTAGLIPKHPAALPWHDQSVAGPMARTAEDCALLLDAMIGLSAKSPLSVPAPWKSARVRLAKAKNLRSLRFAYAPDIAGIGVDAEIERICRNAARDLRDAGAAIEEIDINLYEGRDAFITLRGEAMVGNHLERLERIGELGDNLAGNIRSGLALTVSEIARAERKRAEIWHRWRALFEQYDLILTPTAPVPPFPVEKNYPDVIEGRKMQNYIDWIAPNFLVSLAALPAVSVPAGLTSAKLPVGLQIVGPRFSEPLILTAAKFVEAMHPIGLPPNCG